MPAPLKLTPKGERRLRHGHLWIYRDEIQGAKPEMHGSIVAVNDSSRKFFAHGFYSHKSKIAVRIITRSAQVPDRSFFREAIRAAGLRRKGKAGKNSGVRLVNAEGDFLPGLIADWYAGRIVVQCLVPGVDVLREMFAELLWDEFQPEGLWFRNDSSMRELEGLSLEKFMWRGKETPEVVIEENGLKFLVSLSEGHKTGWYLDQAENHLRAKAFARGRCLDAFCFQGGFALHLAAGAEEVVAVDSSQPALSVLERNCELNRVKNVLPVRANIFEILPELHKRGEKFELVVLDPPPFAKSRKDLGSAAKGYAELNRRGISLLNPGGILISYSCSFHFALPDLMEVVRKACGDLGRQARLIEFHTQAHDHPILFNTPETWYLKGVVAEVD